MLGPKEGAAGPCTNQPSCPTLLKHTGPCCRCEGPILLRYIRRIKLSDLPEEWQEQAPNRHVAEK